MKHRILAVCLTALLLMGMSIPAFAAAEPQATTTPPSPTLYPAEVRASEENGVARLEKVYYLSANDDPTAIPTEDFEREGLHYTLLDVLKTDLTETDTKDYAEVITLDSATKDVGEIIKTLEPEREIVTEEGYRGILTPDYTTIMVEPAGYKTSTWTVSAKRTYPNLSDADVSLLPKSIEDSGRTLTLADVDWQDAGTDYVDGDPLAVRYTAVATYTGTAKGKSVTGYTVTVDYAGEVSRVSDTIVYTAVFSGVNTQQAETGNAEGENSNQLDARLLLIPAGVAGVGAAGYIARKGYKHYINKKRGYE